jgi:hypothetical protein
MTTKEWLLEFLGGAASSASDRGATVTLEVIDKARRLVERCPDEPGEARRLPRIGDCIQMLQPFKELLTVVADTGGRYIVKDSGGWLYSIYPDGEGTGWRFADEEKA